VPSGEGRSQRKLFKLLVFIFGVLPTLALGAVIAPRSGRLDPTFDEPLGVEDLALPAFATDGLQKGSILGSGNLLDSSPVIVGSRRL
jgi:hypothetical protein